MNRRVYRVNAFLRQEISQIIARELRDPRLSTMVSVTHVEVSRGLRNAKVYISVLGNADQKLSILSVLNSASGFINRALRENIDNNSIPFLNFHLDESIEKGIRIIDIIDKFAPHESAEGTGKENGA